MNGAQQQKRRSAIIGLKADMEALARAWDDEIAEAVRDIDRRMREAVGEERTFRLKLAEEQRSYVDAQDRDLRRCCQERWDATSTAQGKIIGIAQELHKLTFWGRFRWLFTGRR